MHLDGVHLGRPLVERPQVSVDADVRYEALVENFDGAHNLLGVVWHRIRRARCRHLHGRCFGRQHLRRIGQRGLDDRFRLRGRHRLGGCSRHRFGDRRHVGVSDSGVAHCGCLRCVRELGVGGERWCAAVLDWRCAGVLDAGRTDGSRPGDDPACENDRSAQRRRHCRKSPRVHDPVASKGSA